MSLALQYHIVWPLSTGIEFLWVQQGNIVYSRILFESKKSGCEVLELNAQKDHIHLLIKVPTKVFILSLMSQLKGKTAIGIFQKDPQKPYWGNHF